jgi:hypothetical protein
MWGSITTSTGINASTLTVESKNSVGELNIGPIQIGMEQSPKWYQKVLYRLLGFKWKKR